MGLMPLTTPYASESKIGNLSLGMPTKLAMACVGIFSAISAAKLNESGVPISSNLSFTRTENLSFIFSMILGENAGRASFLNLK